MPFKVGLDAGGTKTRRGAFFVNPDGKLVPVMKKDGREMRDVVKTDQYPDRQFLLINAEVLSGEPPEAVGYGYAGAFQDGRAEGVNMPWAADDRQLSKAFGCPVRGWNDLPVMVWGLNVLLAEQILLLGGNPARLMLPGAQGFAMAAGTGTGGCAFERRGELFVPTRQTEFGHIRFAPEIGLDIAYLGFLRGRYKTQGRISLEFALKLKHIYEFLRDAERVDVEPEPIRLQIGMGIDPAPTICGLAKRKESKLCQAALDMYCRLMMAAASDGTLAFAAFDWCVLGGGNVPEIGLEYLQGTNPMQTYVSVGHHEPRMKETPVSLIMAEKGDWGAALAVHNAIVAA
jgi:glucokinase